MEYCEHKKLAALVTATEDTHSDEWDGDRPSTYEVHERLYCMDCHASFHMRRVIISPIRVR